MSANPDYPGLDHLPPAKQGILIGEWFQSHNSEFAIMMHQELVADIRLATRTLVAEVNAMENPTEEAMVEMLSAKYTHVLKTWKARLPEGRTDGPEWGIYLHKAEDGYAPVLGEALMAMGAGQCTFPAYLKHPLFPSRFAEWLKTQSV